MPASLPRAWYDVEPEYCPLPEIEKVSRRSLSSGRLYVMDRLALVPGVRVLTGTLYRIPPASYQLAVTVLLRFSVPRSETFRYAKVFLLLKRQFTFAVCEYDGRR